MPDQSDDWDPFEQVAAPPPNRRDEILGSLAEHLSIAETARQHITDRYVQPHPRKRRRKSVILTACRDCKYWESEDNVIGICMRNPPVIFPAGHKFGTKTVTESHERCVGGEPKPDPPPLKILRDEKPCAPPVQRDRIEVRGIGPREGNMGFFDELEDPENVASTCVPLLLILIAIVFAGVGVVCVLGMQRLDAGIPSLILAACCVLVATKSR